jgi:predicted MFS family arabinose efflux permease
VRVPETLGALRERNFRMFFAGQAISLLGDGIVPVALAFAVLEIDDSPSALGLVLAARVLPMVILLLAGGVVADRVSRRRVMIVADLARTASQGLTAALVLGGVAEVWMLAVLAAAGGGATAFFEPASTGLVPMTVDSGRLQQANALLGLSRAAGSIAGPAIAGVLVATVGPGAALAVDAATFGVSAAFLAAVRLARSVHGSAAPFVRELRDGWREFRSRDWLWGIVLIASVANMLAAGYRVLGPVTADRELGGAAAWAAISTAFGVGSFLGGALILRRRVGRPLLVAVVVGAVWVTPWILLAIPASTPVIAAGALLGGVGLMVFNALWQATVQEHVPRRALSRVSAYDWLGSLALDPLGVAVVGPIAAVLGIQATLLACAALVTVLNLWALTIPGVRRLRSVGLVSVENEAAVIGADERR